jgi:hypothetical protein
MPKFRFALFSQRNRPIDDLVSTFIFNGKRSTLRDDRNLKPSSKRFTVDAAPGDYELQLEIDGFDMFRGDMRVTMNTPPVVDVRLTHRCTDLPDFMQLHATQQKMLATFDPNTQQIWQSLSDNQAATFFQVTHALLNTSLANGRALSSYIETVRRIGGVEIEDTILFPPDPGKSRTATGWRMHVVINQADRANLVSDLIERDIFGEQDDSTHSTHRKFGLTKSHRETGPLPKLQIVLSKDNVHADVDLDVELHRSSPHHVFKHFIQKFPEVADIYRF